MALCEFRWEETVKLEFGQRADLADIRRIGIPRAFQERGVHPGDRRDARSAAPEPRLPYPGALPHLRHADLGRGFGYAPRGVLRHDCDEKGPFMKAYLGIDTGSISTKGVVIDENKKIIARSYLWTEGDPSGAVRRVVDDLKGQIDLDEVHVMSIGTTGSARRLVGAMLEAQVVKNEITAHAVGTTFLHPDVRTILEIGGQDSKIICIENGIAVDYAMNTLCAAGTGSFLSSQAHRLGVEVEEFGEIALTSDKPANIAARCTVFAESDLVHKLQVGYEKRDVIAGLCRAVATNYLNNVGKGKKIEAPVVFQGGVSKNVGVVRAFEDALGQKVIVDPDGHLMGCFGAALLAADAPVLRSEPFMFNIDDFEFRTREVVCGHCANHCEIVCVYRDQDLIDSWGNRCDRGAIRPKPKSAVA